MSFNCLYCKKEFSAKSSLNTHLKTAKYCIKNRPIDSPESINITKFECNFCHKSYTKKENLDKHLLSHTKEIEIKQLKELHSNQVEQLKELHSNEIKQLKELHSNEIKQLKELRSNEIKQLNKVIDDKDMTIKDLQNKLFKLASRPTTSYNTINQTNNLVSFNHPDEKFEEKIQQLKFKPVNCKQISQAVGKHYGNYLAQSVAIKDVNRDNYEFLMNDQLYKDPRGQMIIELAEKSYKDRITELVNEAYEIVINDMDKIKDSLEYDLELRLETTERRLKEMSGSEKYINSIKDLKFKLNNIEVECFQHSEYKELLETKLDLIKIKNKYKIERKSFLIGFKDEVSKQKVDLLLLEMDKHPEEYFITP